MIRVFILLLLLLSSMFASANNETIKHNISGKVIDSITQQPIPYATVSISKDNVIIDGVITNENGEFELRIQKGIIL